MSLLHKYQQALAKQIEQLEQQGKDVELIFRGQSDKDWKLNSSADRRLEKASTPYALIEYLTKVLIEPARSEGYAHEPNKELNDLELLAKLQHNGAATCLIDFTANFNIALWFACADDKTDGKVFVVNRRDIDNFKEVTPERAKKAIEELLRPTQQSRSSEIQPEIYYWKPPANENRILVQHSCFIFSGQPITPEIYKEITISKKHKQEMRMLLKKYYGLDNQSIFRDFTGFAASQGQDQSISIDLTSEEQYLRSGNRHYQQGKYEKAIEDYDQAIGINPQDAQAYCNRGNAKGMLNLYEEAIADYDEAIRLNPQDARAYYNRGVTKGMLNLREEEIANYDQAIRLNPQLAPAYNNRGTAKSKLDLHEKAIADYDQAIRLKPQDARAYYNRGTTKGCLGMYKEAIADYDQAIRLKPQKAQAYNKRGTARGCLGMYKEAIADYDQAIRLNPQKAQAYYGRGYMYKAMNEYEKARSDLQHTFELATEQGNQVLAQDAESSLNELPPADSKDSNEGSS